jgi:predicted Rossmann fold nucleotide-binding protein DprA/Smf involved in DNA uptake
MKLVIAGSRTVVNIQHLYNAILTLDLGDTVKNKVTEIISGGANGADKLGEILATKLNKTLTIMPAEWDKYGKGAGYRRNEEMAELGDAVLVLYDGISKGSKHMIELAKKHNKKVWVYYVYVG